MAYPYRESELDPGALHEFLQPFEGNDQPQSWYSRDQSTPRPNIPYPDSDATGGSWTAPDASSAAYFAPSEASAAYFAPSDASTATPSSWQSSEFDHLSRASSSSTGRSSISSSDIYRVPHRQESPRLPCEFFGFDSCDETFHINDIRRWVDHILSHLQDKVPSRVRCWFCDSQNFIAANVNGDVLYNFEARMIHIRDHIVEEGRSVHDMRPDYKFAEYCWQKGLITQEAYGRVCSWSEVPRVRGIHPKNYRTPKEIKKAENEGAVYTKETRRPRRHHDSNRKNSGQPSHSHRP